MPQHKTNPLEVIIGIMNFLAGSIMAFTREGLGARLMPTLFRACIAASIVFMLYRLASPPLPDPVLFPYFLGGLFLLFIGHQLSAWFRRRPDIHSFSTGRTRLRLPVRDSVVHRYIEPVACLGAGVVLTRFDPLLGGWLCGAAVSLFIEEQIARVQGRRRLLDTFDGRIEGKSLQSAVQGRLEPPQTTSAQAPVVIAAKRRGGKRAKVGNFAARLDPGLRRILESDRGSDQKGAP